MKQTNTADDQPERKLRRKIFPTLVWIILIVGDIYLLDQIVQSRRYSDKPPIEESNALTGSTEQRPVPTNTSVVTPTPTQAGYNWEGTMLYLNVPIPENPGEAMVYQLRPEKTASVEMARTLPGQFGLQGEIYEIPPEENYTGKAAYLVVDGNQRLRINSDRDFWYYPDYNRYIHQESDNIARQTISQSDATRLIDDFLHSHGFDFAYDIRAGEFPGDFYVFPLTPDGFVIQTSFFNFIGFSFSFDADGILDISAKLLNYQPIDRYGIISPQTALHRVTEHNTIYGVHVYTKTGNPPTRTWQRSYPKNQTVTIWGPVSSTNAVDGKGPLVTFDGYQVTGNIAGLADFPPSTFIEATGQIQDVNGMETFNIENWQLHNQADWEAGDIRRDGDQVIFMNSKISRLVLPDIPPDLPLPFDNAFVRGIIHDNVYEWKYIDDHLQSEEGQGGGGFVSLFHKLNLTGTPVPLSSPTPEQGTAVSEGRTDYSGQTGTIEEAELSYYFKNPQLVFSGNIAEPIYLQPVWRFYGHFSSGDEFEIFVQALKDEFLSPELESPEP